MRILGPELELQGQGFRVSIRIKVRVSQDCTTSLFGTTTTHIPVRELESLELP